MSMLRQAVRAAAILAALAQPAFAQAPPERIRGDVASVSSEALVVRSRDGGDVTVSLPADTSYRSITPATLADIKPGTLIGIVSRGPADKQVAVAIQIFVPGSAVRQGISPWDMVPESTMTNAAVEGTVQPGASDGLTVKAGDKTVQMAVSPDVSIGQAAAADKSVLVPGAKVVVFAVHEGNAYTARAVIAGKDGMTPPL